MIDLFDTLVGVSDPAFVRCKRQSIDRLKSSLREPGKRHLRMTYEQAVQLQGLQSEYQDATTLMLIDCERGVVTKHPRPDHWVRRAPLAALSFGEAAE